MTEGETRALVVRLREAADRVERDGIWPDWGAEVDLFRAAADRLAVCLDVAEEKCSLCHDDGMACPQCRSHYKAAAHETEAARRNLRIDERVAQLTAHRACTGLEHDPEHGKLHGCCVVCGVPWPCEVAADRLAGLTAPATQRTEP